MLPFFPRQISIKAIAIYLGVLAVITVLFFSHAMSLDFIVMGIIWVVGFFLLSNSCSTKWKTFPRKRFVSALFYSALGVRIVWVLFSYVFYTIKTGIPFEFEAADSIGYWDSGYALSGLKLSELIKVLFPVGGSWSDSGYVFYLALLCKLTGQSILIPRLIKAIIGAVTVLIIFRLAERNIGDEGAKMAGIFACFMPNLIVYCGLHLKETEMLFLMVAYLERADYLLRSKKYNVFTIALPVLLALSLFTLRTVLGAAALFSFATAIVFTSTNVIGKKKRTMLIAWAVLAAAMLAGGTIVNEAEGYWEERYENQSQKRDLQTLAGNKWAKYATGTVMAPMIFVLPFPTMVDVDEQHNQHIMSGGNYVRNFLGVFVLIALFSAIFVTKNWRDLSLIGSFVITYLGIISVSGFANSERFLLPGLPVLLIMAAYGVTMLNAKSYKFVKIWYWVVPLMAFGWAFFKLGSRGLF